MSESGSVIKPKTNLAFTQDLWVLWPATDGVIIVQQTIDDLSVEYIRAGNNIIVADRAITVQTARNNILGQTFTNL